MLARSVNLQQREFQIGLYLAESLLLLVAVIVIIRAIMFAPNPVVYEQPLDTQTLLVTMTDTTLLTHAQDRLKQGDVDGSIAILDVAIEIAPAPSDEMFATRALAYSRMSQFAEAVRDYQAAISYNPNNPMYHTGLCYNSALIRDYTLAVPACDTAITLQPDNWIVWNDRCYLRAYYTGALDDAINDCTQSLVLNPTHPYPYNNRARAFLLRGNYAEAIVDATHSIDLGNRYPALPYTTRGTAYAALGNFGQAMVEYQAALAVDPTYPELLLRLGEWYRYQNQGEQARQAYCRYVEHDRYPIQYAIDQAQALGGCG
jgi:tetratricopeptide (TPR) repeat protein